MTKEPDESLIEATIRRVAEAKAARLARAEREDSATDPAPATPAPAVKAAPDVDEDQIAATIRRVAEADAARRAKSEPEDSTTEHAPAAAEPVLPQPLAPTASAAPDVDEDQIAATIRRVAEAEAARRGKSEREDSADGRGPAAAAPMTPPPPAPTASAAPDVDEDQIAATIRRVAEAEAARRGKSEREDNATERAPAAAAPIMPQPSAPTANAAPDVDEDEIAATIRRVAEAKAARAAEVRPVVDEAPAAPAPGPAATPMPARQQAPDATRKSRDAAEDVLPGVADEPPTPPAPAPRATANPARVSARQSTPVAAPEPRAAADGWTGAVAALRRELAETRRELRELALRFEASIARGAEPRVAPPAVAAAPDNDEWDDAPQVLRIPIGQPPRPAIFRDPSPQTATAARLEPEIETEPETFIDTRPLPKPLPPLHAEPRRGLDLLPRTYRITVEDKRRGVDLVPLHRALLGMDGVRDMSLLSYSNGVAIVAVDMVDELEPETLEGAISRSMSREAKVEVHNDTTMVVKLAEE